MRSVMTFLMALALSALAGCRRNSPPIAQEAGSDTTLVVALERGACYGRCPEYSVELYESGRVIFNGTRNVALVGAVTDTVTNAVVDSAKRLIGGSGFAALDTAFVFGAPGCGQYATDLPVIVLRARVSGNVKSVRHELGCRGAPAVLESLATQVDELTGTAVWIRGKQEAAK